MIEIKKKASISLFAIALLLFSSLWQEAVAGEDAGAFGLKAEDFIGDYIRCLYEMKGVEDPELIGQLKLAVKNDSDEMFIAVWIRCARHLERSLACIKPHASDENPDIRRIAGSLVIYLDPLVSDLNHIISINLERGTHNEEFGGVMRQVNTRLEGLLKQIQISAVEITDMLTARRSDSAKKAVIINGCRLTDEQLRSLLAEIDLFVGDDLTRLGDIGLENIAFSRSGKDIALPNYAWSAIFLKVYLDKALAYRENNRPNPQ